MNDVRRYVDLGLEAALGLTQGISPINKFGRAPSGVQTTATDIWDRADATPTQQIWVAPTQARVHNLVSTSGNDDLAGSGARRVQVYGLTSWSTAEVNEIVDMDGITPVGTTNEYVIIHRMIVRPDSAGVGATNAGTITATAVTDATVTAQINIGEGQTQMAIYGVPSCCTLAIKSFSASQLRATAGATVATDITMMVNEQPDTDVDFFVTKETDALYGAGSTVWERTYDPPKTFAGPAIVKFQATASAADVDLSVSFDAYLVTT